MWDVNGKEYLDFTTGIGVLNTGHRHPEIIAAVKDQLDHYTHTCFQVLAYEPYVELAERLNALAPLEKPVVVRACADCVLADGNVHIREVEIMRALSAAIDCPLPPQVAEPLVAA